MMAKVTCWLLNEGRQLAIGSTNRGIESFSKFRVDAMLDY